MRPLLERIELVESHPASFKERWQMFKFAVQATKGDPAFPRLLVLIAAAEYSTRPTALACTYRVRQDNNSDEGEADGT